MNKKELKQAINSVCSDLFAECVAASMYSGQPNQDDANAILASIVSARNDFVKRISHQEPGLSPKAYYDDLIKNFNQQAEEIVDQIVSLS